MCKLSELAVLVVDSDEESLQEVCDILRALGLVRLVCANDAKSALEWFEPECSKDIDVIMTHNKLSDMDGFVFVHKARDLCPMKQIIMYSTSKKPTAYLTALNVGATEYIDRNDSFVSNVFKKLPFWLDVAQRQFQLMRPCCDARD